MFAIYYNISAFTQHCTLGVAHFSALFLTIPEEAIRGWADEQHFQLVFHPQFIRGLKIILHFKQHFVLFLPLSVNHVAVHLSQILSEIHVENNKPKVLFEISFPEATYSFSFTSSSRFYLTQLCLPVPLACLTLVGLLVFFFFFFS